jgi:predicted kinase
MREFPQEALASRALASGAFGAAAVDGLAEAIAALHARAPAAAPGPLGAPATVLAATLQNFDQMLPRVTRPADRAALGELRRWTEGEFARRRQAIAARKQAGYVRECHGDLHLGNVALLNGRPVPFDGIEFNPELSWIDVMSDVAFLSMDLADRGRPDLAWRFLNRYLEDTGDYGGLEVLRFFTVYRALVRAKIHLIRAQQPGLPDRERTRLARAFRGYLRLAKTCAAPGPAAVIVTHGLSGCGKTTATQSLVETLGGVRVRSDIERKRMHGLAPLAASASAPGEGIYSRGASAATYRRMGRLASDMVGAGYPAIVDAAFLRRNEREAFRALAAELDIPFVILDFRAPLAVLRSRVAARRARGNDASEADQAVLERQIAWCEPLTPAETAAAFVVDGTRAASPRTWRPVMYRLREARRAARRPARNRFQTRKEAA